jgi:hypothetical protein
MPIEQISNKPISQNRPTKKQYKELYKALNNTRKNRMNTPVEEPVIPKILTDKEKRRLEIAKELYNLTFWENFKEARDKLTDEDIADLEPKLFNMTREYWRKWKPDEMTDDNFTRKTSNTNLEDYQRNNSIYNATDYNEFNKLLQPLTDFEKEQIPGLNDVKSEEQWLNWYPEGMTADNKRIKIGKKTSKQIPNNTNRLESALIEAKESNELERKQINLNLKLKLYNARTWNEFKKIRRELTDKGIGKDVPDLSEEEWWRWLPQEMSPDKLEYKKFNSKFWEVFNATSWNEFNEKLSDLTDAEKDLVDMEVFNKSEEEWLIWFPPEMTEGNKKIKKNKIEQEKLKLSEQQTQTESDKFYDMKQITQNQYENILKKDQPPQVDLPPPPQTNLPPAPEQEKGIFFKKVKKLGNEVLSNMTPFPDKLPPPPQPPKGGLAPVNLVDETTPIKRNNTGGRSVTKKTKKRQIIHRKRMSAKKRHRLGTVRRKVK